VGRWHPPAKRRGACTWRTRADDGHQRERLVRRVRVAGRPAGGLGFPSSASRLVPAWYPHPDDKPEGRNKKRARSGTFLRVSDRIRTRDRRDHNPDRRWPAAPTSWRGARRTRLGVRQHQATRTRLVDDDRQAVARSDLKHQKGPARAGPFAIAGARFVRTSDKSGWQRPVRASGPSGADAARAMWCAEGCR
jgi:hypothetical protein